ncbi:MULTISPECIES: hypothetical protein [Thermodesulfovibrio]|jgi:hypothetical protein|uniref:Uncharacterized protein n=1 Tax=Thermodesulfovibrio yellowstonii (strain ATCC 51303 / DSM 11347 / YP87) TaxID=289376 RepID=B5YIN5_THEYD|nr:MULTISPECIES: hypothetical protein [Thermodesulfovibrio]ACI21283.1 conserved hypothetical protein [Thermodesulfovibrio yellowstonii DSM 11347]MBC7189810.1 hypothetical protein [Candidatus Aerophobetes bacterium]MDI6864592.1 hypothetical protein [Thermodesulfovibrio yellowstonii]
MKEQQKPMCIICAWRATCQKQFSLKAGQKCPDFVKDVTVKIEEEEEKEKEQEQK